jgi:hypothetical protein
MPFIVQGKNGPHFFLRPAKNRYFFEKRLSLHQKKLFSPNKILKGRLTGIPFRHRLREKIADSSVK